MADSAEMGNTDFSDGDGDIYSSDTDDSNNMSSNIFALHNRRVALVCDWLTEVGGAENVLIEIVRFFAKNGTVPTVFTSQFRPTCAPEFFAPDGEFAQMGGHVKTGWLNIFPHALRKFLSPLRYRYFSHLDLKKYDLVISVCNAEAKNISKKNLAPGALHISYLQGPPTQYYWREYDRYLANPGFGKLDFLARFGLKLLVRPMRRVDYAASQKPDVLVANSTYVQAEIKEFYQRESEVLFPNVDVENIARIAQEISEDASKEVRRELFDGHDFYICTGRQVNWKRLDIAIDFAKRSGKNLLLIGSGAEHENLVALAESHQSNESNPESPATITFLPRYHGVEEIVKYLVAARGFIFTSIEPFGIAPLESLAAGTPVIAFSKGGSRDFIQPGINGIFFEEQSATSLEQAVAEFESTTWDRGTVQKSATKFSGSYFSEHLEDLIRHVTRTSQNR